MKPLSFIIITYNRPADALELLQNIVSLNDAPALLEEVILVNNASTDDYSAVKDFAASVREVNIRYIDAPGNLGVAKGRNYAITFATAPILIMLDDDAVMGNANCLQQLVREFATKNTERPKAIVSFKVIYYENGQMQVNALPHKRFDAFKDKPFFETYYYAGGAHAIRREVLEAVGNYPEDFFYGMEEYDLSYRILDRGWSIVYSDKIIMRHKESPLGRKPRADKLRMMWVNKSKVAWRYLPKPYFYSTAFMWSLQYLKETGFSLKGYFAGWKQVLAISRSEARKPVSEKTLEYIRSLKARLWY
ncbi:glycosyltransferase family 2 protein [Flaviaesturariibacter flavus]|uniref:Glycosyltransferase family 2 protein n=1 Tax=Flaviaesturariibacter flavus TaxID=2502780 RepID=A0A4R1BJS5_9BACT|nr:glycosyltransferase family 2 protein [Flaviaesturariibacter flavus]TCJ17458.1 glycosyltransferase family 2 protein [Flaviaesturariibacter flavus]